MGGYVKMDLQETGGSTGNVDQISVNTVMNHGCHKIWKVG